MFTEVLWILAAGWLAFSFLKNREKTKNALGFSWKLFRGMALLKKGASVFNLCVFLCVWASIKIPMILFEVKFLGAEFAILRLTLTIPSIIIISGLLKTFRMNITGIQRS